MHNVEPCGPHLVVSESYEVKLITETYPLYLKLKRKRKWEGKCERQTILRHIREGALAGRGPGCWERAEKFLCTEPHTVGVGAGTTKNRKHPNAIKRRLLTHLQVRGPPCSVLWRTTSSQFTGSERRPQHIFEEKNKIKNSICSVIPFM